jgi:hypothetical protein
MVNKSQRHVLVSGDQIHKLLGLYSEEYRRRGKATIKARFWSFVYRKFFPVFQMAYEQKGMKALPPGHAALDPADVSKYDENTAAALWIMRWWTRNDAVDINDLPAFLQSVGID